MLYRKILDRLVKANETLQYPKFHLRYGYKLQLAGANSRCPNTVSITNGKPYGSSDNIFYGRIDKNGVFKCSNAGQQYCENLIVELDLFQLDPVKYAKGFSSIEGSCMYCARRLNHPQSVAVGYGATCAENYGLPWGDIDPEIANKQANMEFDIGDYDLNPINMPVKPDEVKNGVMFDNKLSQTAKLPTNTFDDSIECQNAIITDLKRIAIWRLSLMKYSSLIELLNTCEKEFETQYNLIVATLWENI